MNQRVAVIGSGLAAVGAIKALVKLGIKPTVIDLGENLEEKLLKIVDGLSQKNPEEWTEIERKSISKNDTLKNKGSIPQKLMFGSSFFYGKSKEDAPVVGMGDLLPFSYALGGLSVGWGAASLPPQPSDLTDWPIDSNEINRCYEAILKDLPYSAKNDGLSVNFPVLKNNISALALSDGEKLILASMKNAYILKKDSLVYGQARLIVSPENTDEYTGCTYCGECMSGCVYKSIYKAGDEIKRLQLNGQISYISGCLVQTLSEKDNVVTIEYVTNLGRINSDSFDKVFLAAGAVNSTRIVLNSLGKYSDMVEVKTRGGFVIPAFSFRSIYSNWPKSNTLPGIFLELKGKSLKHWVHIQVSVVNELLLQKLNVQFDAKDIITRIKKFISRHVLIIFVNYHSDHSGLYKIWLTPSKTPNGISQLNFIHEAKFPQKSVFLISMFKIFGLFCRIGCLPLIFMSKLNSGSYHVGGSMPMKSNPVGELETDVLGRNKAWKNIHIVDSSIFPSLPGTTIGLLSMANAYRIVDSIHWLEFPDLESK